jgi:hypothetical protein
VALGEASEYCQTLGKAENNGSETWYEIWYTETRTRPCWIVVKWYGALVRLVRLVLSSQMLGCNGNVEREDSVAVQGMWRPSLGHMHHAFLQRNYEKLETMYQATVWSRFGRWRRRGYCFFFKRCTYADLNSTVAALRGLVYQLVLQERSLLHILQKRYNEAKKASV